MVLNKRFFAAISAACLLGSVAVQAEDMKFDWSTIRPGFTLQTWAIRDTATPTTTNPNFIIRRAEIRFSGNVGENARWFVMSDMAKNLGVDLKFLQDIGAAYTVYPGLEFTVGQFKILTTAEGLEKSSELILPERSNVGRTYGDQREPGAMVTYKTGAFQVGGMVSNGQGPNTSDNNDLKRASVRADYTLLDGINVGAFTQAQDFSWQNGSYGANVRLAMGDLLVQAEGVLGTAQDVANNGINSNGAQVTLAYMLASVWQPVARFETQSNNTNFVSRGNGYTLGLNYYISKNNAKIQASYSYLDNQQFIGNRQTYLNTNSGALIIVSFQAAI